MILQLGPPVVPFVPHGAKSLKCKGLIGPPHSRALFIRSQNSSSLSGSQLKCVQSSYYHWNDTCNAIFDHGYHWKLIFMGQSTEAFGLTAIRVSSTSSVTSDAEIRFCSRFRGVCFYILTGIIAIFIFPVMLFQHPLVMLLDQHKRNTHHVLAKIWASSTLLPFLHMEIEGMENLPSANLPAVYVSNHQSFLDIYVLLALGRNFKLISKATVFYFPLIGWAMNMIGVIPLDRMDRRSQLDCLKRCIDLVRDGVSVLFFPEGTRSKDGKLGDFKKGAFTVAAKTKVPVVPITLIGTGRIMPVGMEHILNPGSVKVVIHKPIQDSNPDTLCSLSARAIGYPIDPQI